MGFRMNWLRGALVVVGMVGAAQAQTVKVGIIGPFSGPFAHYGTLFKAGAEAYVASQGGKLAGQNIEFVWRDEGGPNPANTRTLAQELVVKDKVDYIGGIVFSPNATAVAPVIQESKTPMVIFNAATSDITTKSDYYIRTSYTLWQVTVPAAQHGASMLKRRSKLNLPSSAVRSPSPSACRCAPPISRLSRSASRPVARRRSMCFCPAARPISAL